MSFDYDKVSRKANGGEHGSWWTSYADLFMMLSIVFLLMFVASSLRSGSVGFQKQIAYEQLQKKAEDLEEQIKVYDTLKDQTLRQQSSQQDQEVYQKLMSKLSLLQDDAHDEKLALEEKVKENSDKEFALNQYQQMIRNIINTNILAKAQIQHRDQLIVTKDATIDEKQKAIAQLQQTIDQNQQKIDSINAKLAENIQSLRKEHKNAVISQVILDRRIAALRQQRDQQVQTLQQKNNTVALELNQVRGTLVATQKTLDQANVTIDQQQQDNGALKAQLEQTRTQYIAELSDLQKKHKALLSAERATFDRRLKRQQLSHAARVRKLAEFLENEKRKAGAYQGKLAGLKNKIAETESQLQGVQNTLAGTEQKLQGTEQALSGTETKLAGARAENGRAIAAIQGLQGDLAHMRAIANARKKLADEIAAQLEKSGLRGAVNARTGEVTLDFGQDYFDTGSTLLKPRMRTTLDKFIPLYAKTLFSNKKLAEKIANVEIIGFASSTYKGHYVNPKSVREEDKQAIEYNLKLSFGRANSIFHHVLSEKQLDEKSRNELLPLIKVVGRGYLPEGVSASDLPDRMTEKEFCAQYNCKQAQKVIVKFNMKD